ncbi:MAG: alkylmercury lyase family protein [Pseudonocardia sp.]|nr:alkylmercury lyase family protein [Pseudonocardia sp.]
MTISGSAGDLATVLARAGLPADNLPARRSVLPSLRDLHRLVLASFAATGGPPVAADLTAWPRAHGVDLRQALRELGDTVLVFTDLCATAGTGAVLRRRHLGPAGGAFAGGPQAFANCAIDALGSAAMLDRDIAIGSPPAAANR